MGRSPCCAKVGLNRGAWTAHEDQALTDYIRTHGEGGWRNLPKRAGLKRCGKSCRLRWLNYLRPDIKRGNISSDEEELIIRLHNLLGNRWSLIAGRLPGRTDNEIKNYWNTNILKKRLQEQENAKGEKKPKNYKQSEPEPPKMQSQVIRTKAIKCTKVVMIPHLIHQNDTTSAADLLHSNTTTPISEDGENDNTIMNYKANGDLSGCDFDLLSSGSGDQENNNNGNLCWDLNMNFNMDDICLSDLLDSDFSDICAVGLSSEQSDMIMCSKEMMQDFNVADFINLDNSQFSAG